MIYDYNEIANYVICYSNKNGIYMSNLKLQKIMYFIQNKLLNNYSGMKATFIAWENGPTIKPLYNNFSGFGSSQLFMLNEPKQFNILEHDRKIIDTILEKTKNVNPMKLVDISHNVNNSWNKIYRNKLGYGEIIPNEMIKEDVINLDNLDKDEIW